MLVTVTVTVTTPSAQCTTTNNVKDIVIVSAKTIFESAENIKSTGRGSMTNIGCILHNETAATLANVNNQQTHFGRGSFMCINNLRLSKRTKTFA